MFAATSAAINNDNLANAIGAAVTLMLLRVLMAERPGDGLPLVLGVLIGLGVLTKLTLGYFLPLAILALGFRARQCGQPRAVALRQSLLVLVALVVVMSPWLVRQGLTYGWDDLLAKRRHDEILIGRAFPSFEPSYLEAWANRLFRSGWALFGWMQIPTAEKLYQVWSGLCQLAVVGVGLAVLRRRQPRIVLLVGVVLGALATVVYYNVTTDVQPQGRFLFVSLAAIVPLFALGWTALVPARARLPSLCALDVGLLGLNLYTLLAYLRPAF
jgi:4-amino-4-deoxy-L-arabinose transferase-like glycosyltransferase